MHACEQQQQEHVNRDTACETAVPVRGLAAAAAEQREQKREKEETPSPQQNSSTRKAAAQGRQQHKGSSSTRDAATLFGCGLRDVYLIVVAAFKAPCPFFVDLVASPFLLSPLPLVFFCVFLFPSVSPCVSLLFRVPPPSCLRVSGSSCLPVSQPWPLLSHLLGITSLVSVASLSRLLGVPCLVSLTSPISPWCRLLCLS